jgi:hypothetical protein
VTRPVDTSSAKPPGAAGDGASLLADIIANANTPQERAAAWDLADTIKQAEMTRRVSQVIAATEWGAALSESRRVAFSRYCLALGADPLRHVDLLGGTPFVNGDYFRDVIAANPEFDHADDPRWIHHDKRLEALSVDETATEADRAWAKQENDERRRTRIEQNVPDGCPSACILTLHYKGGRGPFRGIGRVRGGTTVNGKPQDPIGLEHPRETAETRAWREAGEKCEATWFRTHSRTLERLAAKVQQAYRAEKAGPQEPADTLPSASPGVAVNERGGRLTTGGAYHAPLPAIGDGYELDERPSDEERQAS